MFTYHLRLFRDDRERYISSEQLESLPTISAGVKCWKKYLTPGGETPKTATTIAVEEGNTFGRAIEQALPASLKELSKPLLLAWREETCQHQALMSLSSEASHCVPRMLLEETASQYQLLFELLTHTDYEVDVVELGKIVLEDYRNLKQPVGCGEGITQLYTDLLPRVHMKLFQLLQYLLKDEVTEDFAREILTAISESESQIGLYETLAAIVCLRLGDEEAIASAKLLPVTLLSAASPLLRLLFARLDGYQLDLSPLTEFANQLLEEKLHFSYSMNVYTAVYQVCELFPQNPALLCSILRHCEPLAYFVWDSYLRPSLTGPVIVSPVVGAACLFPLDPLPLIMLLKSLLSVSSLRNDVIKCMEGELKRFTFSAKPSDFNGQFIDNNDVVFQRSYQPLPGVDLEIQQCSVATLLRQVEGRASLQIHLPWRLSELLAAITRTLLRPDTQLEIDGVREMLELAALVLELEIQELKCFSRLVLGMALSLLPRLLTTRRSLAALFRLFSHDSVQLICLVLADLRESNLRHIFSSGDAVNAFLVLCASTDVVVPNLVKQFYCRHVAEILSPEPARLLLLLRLSEWDKEGVALQYVLTTDRPAHNVERFALIKARQQGRHVLVSSDLPSRSRTDIVLCRLLLLEEGRQLSRSALHWLTYAAANELEDSAVRLRALILLAALPPAALSCSRQEPEGLLKKMLDTPQAVSRPPALLVASLRFAHSLWPFSSDLLTHLVPVTKIIYSDKPIYQAEELLAACLAYELLLLNDETSAKLEMDRLIMWVERWSEHTLCNESPSTQELFANWTIVITLLVTRRSDSVKPLVRSRLALALVPLLPAATHIAELLNLIIARWHSDLLSVQDKLISAMATEPSAVAPLSSWLLHHDLPSCVSAEAIISRLCESLGAPSELEISALLLLVSRQPELRIPSRVATVLANLELSETSLQLLARMSSHNELLATSLEEHLLLTDPSPARLHCALTAITSPRAAASFCGIHSAWFRKACTEDRVSDVLALLVILQRADDFNLVSLASMAVYTSAHWLQGKQLPVEDCLKVLRLAAAYMLKFARDERYPAILEQTNSLTPPEVSPSGEYHLTFGHITAALLICARVQANSPAAENLAVLATVQLLRPQVQKADAGVVVELTDVLRLLPDSQLIRTLQATIAAH